MAESGAKVEDRAGRLMRGRPWLALAALGLLVRLWALPSPGMMDVKAWKAWSLVAAREGLAHVYGPSDQELVRLAQQHGGFGSLASMRFPWAMHAYRGEVYFVDYPPASMVLLWAVGRLDLWFDPAGDNGRLLNVLLNLLHLLGSLAIALLLWRSAPAPIGTKRALTFWLNPALLLASVLGYQDPLMSAVALLAVVAMERDRLVWASALVVLTGLLKPQGSLLLPTLVALLFADRRPRTWLRAALVGGLVAAVVLVPWWTQGHLLSALDGCRRPLVESTVSAQGLNLWWMAGYAAQWAHEKAFPLARILFHDEFAALAGWDVRTPARALLLIATLANLILLLRRPRSDSLRVPCPSFSRPTSTPSSVRASMRTTPTLRSCSRHCWSTAGSRHGPTWGAAPRCFSPTSSCSRASAGG